MSVFGKDNGASDVKVENFTLCYFGSLDILNETLLQHNRISGPAS